MANIAENPINAQESNDTKTMRFYNDVSEMIGRTPLVRINRLNPHQEILLLAKIEGVNPGGSVKDRIAKYMIGDAIERGLLTKDGILIEATSGNTGIGLAMMCAIKGYRCELVMPANMSLERRNVMEAYGATVILTPSELGMDGAQDYVIRKLEEEPEKYFSPNQFDNPVNWRAHYETTAREILEDTDGSITHFVAGLGTSGTLMGVGKGLKKLVPAVRIVSVEPESGSIIQGLKDLKTQYVPGIFDVTVLDQRMHIDDSSANDTTRKLALEEGLFMGQSSGAAMCGALEVVKDLHQQNEKDAVVVVLLADSGYKYISKSTISIKEQPTVLSGSIKEERATCTQTS
ncbi:MAG: PLP-dependent cysteine synthase family protein [Candidatus Thorarchaeota archaeon]